MIDDRLKQLREKLIVMAVLVESMIMRSIKALQDKNVELIRQVIDIDEPKVNEMEIEIDEMCASIIALFQPEAKDLRTVVTVLKINNDLERIGDMAVNICESAEFLINRPKVKPLINIPNMQSETVAMLKDSITAFTNENVELARNVISRDDIVDDYKDQIIRELITYMLSDAQTIERAIHLMSIATNLERIADLSTNICEDTIFMVEGKIVKHMNDM